MGLIRFIQNHNRNQELRNINQALREKDRGSQEIVYPHPTNRDRNCPKCKKSIPFDADYKVCPYCNYEFVDYFKSKNEKPTSESSVKTLFCRECGVKIVADSKFCKECGTKL